MPRALPHDALIQGFLWCGRLARTDRAHCHMCGRDGRTTRTTIVLTTKKPGGDGSPPGGNGRYRDDR